MTDPILNMEAVVLAARKRVILRALEASGGNRSKAAMLLGIKRANLYYWMKHFGMPRKWAAERVEVEVVEQEVYDVADRGC